MDGTGKGSGGREGLSRREALGILGAAGAAALVGYRLSDAEAAEEAVRVAHGLDCVATPAQTEGPYFIDERLLRADLRVDPTTNAVKDGLPLTLKFNVSRVDGATCTPVEGAMVDIWQCDALGVYSDVRDFGGQFDTRGQKFLRGYQLTDRAGLAEFVTVYPGWYSGRAVHIHFKVRVKPGEGQSHELTSQLYFDEAVTDEVHARPPYSTKGRRDTLNDRDGIFRRSDGSELMLRLTRGQQGYTGAIAVGLRMPAA